MSEADSPQSRKKVGLTMHAQFDGFSVVGAVEQILDGTAPEFGGAAGLPVPEMGHEGRGGAVNDC